MADSAAARPSGRATALVMSHPHLQGLPCLSESPKARLCLGSSSSRIPPATLLASLSLLPSILAHSLACLASKLPTSWHDDSSRNWAQNNASKFAFHVGHSCDYLHER